MFDVREEDIDRITETFHLILKGKIPKSIELPENYPDNEVKQLVEYVNRFIVEYRTFADILSTLSRGELDFDPPKSKMHILQSFKNLHANLRHLTWKTQQIAMGDFTQKVDFMGDFSKAFNSMTQQLQFAFEKIEKQNQELLSANERMKRDLDAAAEVQRSLLPEILPDALGVNFAWHYEPCDELGGDILNVLDLNDRRIAMYLLDVSGHGVPAALLSVTLSRVLSAKNAIPPNPVGCDATADVIENQTPQMIVRQLNQQFPMSSNNGRYFTMAYAVLEVGTGLLRYILAGHPPPILMRKDQSPQLLTGGGLPVGMFDDAEYEEYSIQLNPGDRLYFYSDGITEAKNKQGAMLDTEGLIRFIEKLRRHLLKESLVACIDKLRRWCTPASFADDVSLLAFELPD